jgi:hypothetical protein
VAHNKAYGHIEAVRGKPKVDEDGKVIKDEKTGAIEYEGDVYLNNYFERRQRQYKDNPDALMPFKMPPSPSADNPDEPSTIAH